MTRADNIYWSIRGKRLDLSQRPLVMGVLNVTPDSFSDGGWYYAPRAALDHALAMIEEGADIIDVGGESSRPGALPISIEEELDRVLPVIRFLKETGDISISIDTTKAEVARQAIEAGAHIINDIDGLRRDPEIGRVAAQTGAGLVLMHMQGTPRTMQNAPEYSDLVGEIANFLVSAAAKALTLGVEPTAIVLDPGIGFGKTWQHNWEILAFLEDFQPLGYPLLIGTSRKRFLRECVGEDLRDLEFATLTTSIVACIEGVKIIRVHDVRSHRKAMDVLQNLLPLMVRRNTGRS